MLSSHKQTVSYSTNTSGFHVQQDYTTLTVVNPLNNSHISHYSDPNSGLGKRISSQRPLSLLGTELFCAVCFHLQCSLLVRLQYCTASPDLVFLQHNEDLCDKPARETCLDTHINAIWPRSARGAGWAWLALRSRWAALKRRQKGKR